MKPSAKQELYLKILGMVLPFMRNIQRHSLWRRATYGSFYLEMELVHNLPDCLMTPEFSEKDVYWLNTQARMFVEGGGNRTHGFYDEITSCISKLIALVPESLKDKLTWRGPMKSNTNLPVSRQKV